MPHLLYGAVGLAGLLVTLALSWQTARATRGYEKVPIHWGLTFNPDRFGSRWWAIALIPGIHVATLGLIWLLSARDLPRHGNALVGCISVGLTFAWCQGLFLFLLLRWRRRQG